MIRVRLSQHETAEEEYFWPAVRTSLPDGHRLADQALEQEQEGKDLLQELQGLAGDDDRFDELVEQLVAALRKHVAFEDTVLLEVTEMMPPEVRSEIGDRFRSAKEHAPTRPHPHAPNRAGPLRAAAGLKPANKTTERKDKERREPRG
jgi:hypothetical protein